MSIFKRNADDDKTLQDVIDDHLNLMANIQKDSPEFEPMLAKLERLYKLKNVDRSGKPSPDAWLAAGASIATILLVINHERLNVISTKAMSFVQRPKL